MATSEESIVLLTDGAASLLAAKTATSILRYRGENVVAVLDRSRAGQTTDQAFGVGGDTPIVAALSDVPDATTLTIGIAPPGGRVPEDWRAILIEAAGRGMKLVSGLHDFLSNDPEIAAAAEKSGSVIYDVRRNNERDLAKAKDLRDDCLRILTVGQDCSIGKMLTALELIKGLTARDVDAKFIATGQTGIMIEGDGCPVDCVVSDFVNGAVEKQILANQHHEVLIVEGQATISHPAYSCVSAGLLHGSTPHGMIMVYEVGRENVHGVEHVPLQPLPKLIEAHEMLAGLRMPSKVIGIAMNSRRVSEEEAAVERERMRGELGLPIADPLRHGVDELVDAIEKLRAEVKSR
ncbi:hypothetical protein Pla123a_12220 [Posidoniimonas polymericola]|uniref:DUF1611 domain-containing protein n=1 Tax=Posidoniimonas polymericola TaxID=2528002 RepID=A0A5C5YUC3_9BACT|nr:DUF1611 domain-containing protein [Posidoniimonas polymericola]TWT78430.1 hypothetical protein Pla123a_12220 [Posidoniimonas polymericola]